MRYYIVSWDNLGVEFFQDITEHHPENWAKAHLFDSIKESAVVNGPALGFSLTGLLLRARMNPERHYEIYVFTSTDDVSADDIKHWFTETPQAFADWVRKNHSLKLFSNRKTTKDIIE